MTDHNPTFSGFVKAEVQATSMPKSLPLPGRGPHWANQKTYSEGTLIYNWNEDKFDVRSMSKLVPQPSQFDHYYQSTYRDSYSSRAPRMPDCLKHTAGKNLKPRAFPAHQPILDSPKLKADYSSYMTSSRDYGSTIIAPPNLD